MRQQIRGGRKGRAERQGLGQSPNKITRLGGLRQVIRCRAGAGGQGKPVAMESPKALMCPLEKGDRGINRAAAETQKAFVNDNETVEAEALEDAEAGPTVTVAVPRESVTEQEAAIELEAATELEEASELEEARERTMT